jgi:hypothetical protein
MLEGTVAQPATVMMWFTPNLSNIIDIIVNVMPTP